jgi:hypothetical protein
MKAIYLAVLVLMILSGCGAGSGSWPVVNSPPPVVNSPPPVVVRNTPSYYETTEYNAQYGLGSIQASKTYSDGNSGGGVIVAVIDVGVDLDHPDLVSNIASGGYDYLDNDSDANPNGQGALMSHGTHIAGIIAGIKNDIGMHGVAYNAKILALRAGGSSGVLSSINIERSIDRAISQDAKVINASFGSADFDFSLANKWKLAHTNDIVSVHSAGNSSALNPSYGALIPTESGYETLAGTLIAVVATDSGNVIADYSNKCGRAKNWCLAAPGTSVYSTVDTTDDAYSGDYGTKSGASLAAPHVSGAAAVLRSKWPSKTAAEVVTILYDTATDLGVIGVDEIYGRGLLNLDNAVYAQGILTVKTASGGSYYLKDSNLETSSILGSALSQAVETAVYDKYKRDYYYNLDLVIVEADAASLLDGLKYNSERLEVNQPSLRFSKYNNQINIDKSASNFTISFSKNKPLSSSFSLSKIKADQRIPHRFSLDGNTHLNQVNNAHALSIINSGKIKFRAGIFSGFTNKYNLHLVSGFSLSVLSVPKKGLSMEIQLNQLNENDTFLSNYFSGAYKTGNSRTNSINITSSSDLGNELNFIAQISKGKTQVNTLFNSVVSNITDIGTSGYSVSLIKSGFLSKNDSAYISFKQPLKIDDGNLTLKTADGLNMDDSISFIDRDVSLASVKSEKVYTIGYSLNTEVDGNVSVLVNYRKNPNHDIKIKEEYQMIVKWTRKF